MNIGPYRVLAEIGHGGMGVVYKATRPTSRSVVAIKMIKGFASLEQRSRMGLVREARTAGGLHHPNIVRIHDIGQHEGWLYIVMEYFDGVGLDRIIQSQAALSIVQKLQVLIQLCSALDFAHRCGVVHRDVKPANVLVSRTGTVKVVDFGLAVHANAPTGSPFAGTFPYMSPEQLKGLALDGRSDIWSAGVTMYELLTGVLPFRGATAGEIRDQILAAPLPELDGEFPLISELNNILRTALTKKRESRYGTAGAFEAGLRSAQSALNAISSTPSATQPGIDPQQRPAIAGESQRRPSTATGYRGWDLGLHTSPSGAVSIRSGQFSLTQLQRRLDLHWAWLTLLTVIAVASLQYFGVSVPTVWRALIYVALPSFLVWRVLMYLLRGIDAILQHPRCRACSLNMPLTSRWTRFVKTNTEVVMGYRDCVSALQENLWEDAAKLLSIHGTEPTTLHGNRLISTPLRYHLEFYECRACGHRAARLTTDDLVDERWHSRLQYTEAYQGATYTNPAVLKNKWTAPRRIADLFFYVVRHLGPIRVDLRIVRGFLVLSLIVGALLYQGRRAAEARQYWAVTGEYVRRGVVAEDSRNYPEAVEWYRKAAERGSAYAATHLGMMYYYGAGVPKDTNMGLYWFRTAKSLNPQH
jgi:serine/threonine protein kinase